MVDQEIVSLERDLVFTEIHLLVATSAITGRPIWADLEAKLISERLHPRAMTEDEIADEIWHLAVEGKVAAVHAPPAGA